MGKLDHLKIKKCPAAFADFARAFNQQVDLIANMQGGPGIDVQVAHAPRKIVAKPGDPRPKEQPRGMIKFTMRPSAINGIGVGGNAGDTNTVNTNCVAADGSLTLLSVPGAALQPTTFPTALRTVNNANVTNINALGIDVVGSTSPTRHARIQHDKIRSDSTTNAAYAEMQPGYVGADNNGNGAAFDIAGGTVYLAYRNGGAIACTIPLASLARNMTIKTIAVCNGNSSQSMDVIASDPY